MLLIYMVGYRPYRLDHQWRSQTIHYLTKQTLRGATTGDNCKLSNSTESSEPRPLTPSDSKQLSHIVGGEMSTRNFGSKVIWFQLGVDGTTHLGK